MILEDEQEFDSTIIDNKRIILKKCADILSHKLYYASDEHVDRVFNGLVNLYPKENSWLLSFKYQCLAEIHKRYLNNNYYYSISCYENALSILLEYLNDTESNCSLNIAYIYHAIAYYYDQVSDEVDLALKYYELAIHYNQIAMGNEISTIYEQMELCRRASFIYERKMAINNENLRSENGLKCIKYKEQEIEKNIRILLFTLH